MRNYDKKTKHLRYGMLFLIAMLTITINSDTGINAESPQDIALHSKADLTIQDKKEPLQGDVHKERENESKEVEQLDHELIVELTEGFMNQLVQPVDEANKVKNYDSKDSLLSDFEPYSSIEVARTYVDYYYKEDQEGLYIRPTETPPWFVNEAPYDNIKLDDRHFRIKQTNKSELYGEYTIQIDFEYDGAWKITRIEHL
ncbi:hypothetical protein [Thalassobacillus hwangdonensis]|uniref:DUF3993 domain-containing protein n=1 Tax=Thalassobacillus hwangdonensis TaxID=546108 RepID=A0ABW3L3H6_9BACI